METTIHVENLHCESCVRAIKESLHNLSPIPSSVDVNLDLQSVRVVHDPDLLEKILLVLLDAGFNIDVGSFDRKAMDDNPTMLSGKVGIHEKFCPECRQKPGALASPTAALSPESLVENANRYKLTLSVGGMTCSSCAQSVTDAMTGIDGVDNPAVSLIDNFATCILEKECMADVVRTGIEECGFEVHVVSIKPERQFTTAEGLTSVRTVPLKVDGISDTQGLEKIMSVIESIGNGVTVKKALATNGDPLVVVSYAPAPPSFTIRNIVSAIERSNDPPYRVSVHRPPSLEEWTKATHTRGRRRILFRLIVAIVAAIPAFIIGVVYMSLVHDGNPGKLYLMEPIWSGNASRSEWALFFISTPVMFYSASVFHQNTVNEIRALWKRGATLLHKFTRFGSMDLLVTSGVSVAYFASLALLIQAATKSPMDKPDNTTYFDAVVFLTMFLLIGRMVSTLAKRRLSVIEGRLIETANKSRTADAITALSSLRPSDALLVVPDSFSPGKTCIEKVEEGTRKSGDEISDSMLPGMKIQTVSLDFLEIGDVICVPHGATPPADGIVSDGETSMFDESSLTGESQLVPKHSSDRVFVGTINKGRVVHVKVCALGEATMLENIVKVVREGQTRRAPIERLANVITSYFVPVITLIAIITWLVWLFLGISGALPGSYLDIGAGGWAVWSLRFAIAVFVSACPCGIGLAAPTAFVVGMGTAAKHGILARGGGEAFQEMSQLDVIVFDKTGTLTEGGEPRVAEFNYLAGEKWTEDMVKGVAAELENRSSHPLAGAIRQYCQVENVAGLVPTEYDEVPGRGVKATFKALQCSAIIGNEEWMREHEATVDDALLKQLELWKSEGKSVALFAVCDSELPSCERTFKIAAAFAIADVIRPKAAEIIAWFQQQGIDTWMITGDNPKTAGVIASLVGIPQGNVIAGVLPQQKSEKVQELQHGNIGRNSKRGRNLVAMVGDGINDAPALAIADVGVAIGSGSDVAISSASFILVSSNLASLITLRDLSKTVMNRVKFNFFWALIYNVITVPIAAGVIYPAGHARLDPAWASLVMELSSCSVVFSSLLLKAYKVPNAAHE